MMVTTTAMAMGPGQAGVLKGDKETMEKRGQS